MEWNGLWGLIYGLFGGFFEFLPASPHLHKQLILKISGLASPGYGISLAVHIGALAAVILSCYPIVVKYFKEQKIHNKPRRYRTRQPNAATLMEYKLLKIAAVPLFLSCLAGNWLGQYFNRLWVMAFLVILNGVVVFLPHYMSHANKDARAMSPLDATLIGFSGIFGVIPGISRMGVLTSIASVRGLDGEFALKFATVLMIPSLIATCLGDVGMLIVSGNVQAVPLFTAVLACVASFGAAMAAVRTMRFLAVKSNYEGFAYYNWGLAMFAFIIYLIG